MGNSISHTYQIDGMSCGGCATTVQNKLSAIEGVNSVRVNLAKKEAEITSYSEIKIESLQNALTHTGYSIEELVGHAANATHENVQKKQQPGHWADGSVVHSPSVHVKSHHSSDLSGPGIGSINTGPVTSYEEE